MKFMIMSAVLVFQVIANADSEVGGSSFESFYNQNFAAPISIASNVKKGVAKSDLIVGDTYFIQTDGLNVRASYSATQQNVVGQLLVNDQVQLLDVMDDSLALVKVRVISGMISTSAPSEVYISKDYMGKSRVTGQSMKSTSAAGNSKLFIVQNIATERTRVYEKCTAYPGCPHRMIFETEMVVGRPDGDSDNQHRFKTAVGHYRIADWVKFYEDGQRHYPSWYDPNYPQVPYDGGTFTWLGSSIIPKSAKESWPSGVSGLRGAFGWYAAMTTPIGESQWIHGTFGWGHEGNDFIKRTRKALTNLVSDPQSAGCTRVENRAVAFLRHIVPVGTDVFRVYAKEGFTPDYMNTYTQGSKTWRYILTKDGVRKSMGSDADANTVLNRGLPQSEYLESGEYEYQTRPSAIGFTHGRRGLFNRKKLKCSHDYTGKSGNTYCVGVDNMHGVFLVDQGLFVDYRHPQDEKIKINGFKETRDQLPEFVRASDASNIQNIIYPPSHYE